MALVGGVSVLCSPTYFVAFSKAGMLSPEGVCWTFDRRANGYVRGEGAGLILLKPLARAIADRDRICGVIKGTAVNHGGKVRSVTSPSAFAQARVVTEAYLKAGVPPDTVSYIECHGTGTPKGDPIELHGLHRAFTSLAETYGVALPERGCGLGSVKTNIGHLEAAAGIAGIIKALLCMRHQALPGLLHFAELNPRIRLAGGPFYVVERLQEWTPAPSTGLRRAGVSSFGFGGVNAHVVLEEYQEAPAPREPGQAGGLFVLSAKTEERLRVYAGLLGEYLASEDARDVCPSDIAYTLQRREPMEERAAFEAHSLAELKIKLAQVARGDFDSPSSLRGSMTGQAASQGESAEPAAGEFGTTGRDVTSLAKLWVSGHPIDWRRLHSPDSTARGLALPTYPFERRRYWLPRSTSSTYLAGPVSCTAMNAGRMLAASTVWELLPGWVARKLRRHDDRTVGGTEFRPVCLTAVEGAGEAFALPAESHCIPVQLPTDGESGRAWIEACWKNLELVQSVLGGGPASSILLLSNKNHEFCTALFALLGSIQKELDLPASWYRWDGDLIPDTARLANAILGDAQDHRTIAGEKRLRRAGDELVCDERVWSIRPFLPPATPAIRPEGGVYWIVGGNGGIGRKVGVHLANRDHATVILSGRTEIGAEETELLERNLTPRGTIRYRSADCTDLGAMRRVFSWIMETYGVLNGVIHAAGTLRDRSMYAKTSREVHEVMAPKVEGAWILDEVTKTCRLDFFMLFSSIAGLWGNPGQSDYAAANAFLRGFADRRREGVARGQRYGHTSVIHWPYWERGGMRLAQRHIDRLEAELGVRPLRDDDGMAILDHALATRAHELSFLCGTQEALTESLDRLGPSSKVSSPPDMPLAQVAEAGPDHGVESIKRGVTTIVAELTGSSPEQLVLDAHFAEYGVDSILLHKLVRRLNDMYAQALTVVDLHNHPSILELSELIRGKEPTSRELPLQRPVARRAPAATRERGWEEIAIVGVDLHVPGARSPDDLWELVIGGPRSPSAYPEERWRLLPGELTANERREDCSGFFLDGVLGFDHQLFGVSPREAMLMDPQQRLVLQSVWRAIEGAGYSRKEFARRATSVFLAIDAVDYEHLTRYDTAVDEFTATGVSRYIAANRISRTFDLRGLSETVATACSSFFVGLGRAVEALRDGTAEQAIVAAVQLNLLPSRFQLLRQRGLLSRSGATLPFDRAADGFVRGEGVGTVVLKPLPRAIEDGDQVHAVLKGVGVWHAGAAMSVTAPSSSAHQRAMTRALEAAAIPAERLIYVEAHGTGMGVGDASELDAIQRVFAGVRRDPEAPCFLGAAKSVLGHLEAASGVAALAKVVLALQRQTAPGLPHLKDIHSQFDPASGLRASLQAAPLPEPPDTAPRCAGLLSYGLGGVSAFVVLQEHRGGGGVPRAASVRRPGLLVLSAQSEMRLAAYLETIQSYLARAKASGRDVDLDRVIETYQCHREHMMHRVAITARSPEELASKIEALLRREAVDGAWHSSNTNLSASNRPGTAVAAEDDAARIRSLAVTWVTGADVQWPEGHLDRCALPGYPFERLREFWFSQGSVAEVSR